MKKPSEITIAQEAGRCLLCYDAPCSKACPAKNQPSELIRTIRFRNLKGGARMLMKNNIVSPVCEEICHSAKYCQGACIRGRLDQPINIPMLMGYLSAYYSEDNTGLTAPAPSGKSAAVFGAGLSALTAASELARAGVEVTIYSNGRLGGIQTLREMTAKGLDHDIINQVANRVRALGVKIVSPIQLDQLLNQPSFSSRNFDALIVSSKQWGDIIETCSTNDRLFLTGELAPGADDAAYLVSKGKATAVKVLAFLQTENRKEG